jgi:hypothetical protein
VQRMAKGAKADTLELLQFLHKTLTRERPNPARGPAAARRTHARGGPPATRRHPAWHHAPSRPTPPAAPAPAGGEPLPSYNGRERRAISLKGGTDNIPVPSWMTASFDNYGRGSGCGWPALLQDCRVGCVGFAGWCRGCWRRRRCCLAAVLQPALPLAVLLEQRGAVHAIQGQSTSSCSDAPLGLTPGAHPRRVPDQPPPPAAPPLPRSQDLQRQLGLRHRAAAVAQVRSAPASLPPHRSAAAGRVPGLALACTAAAAVCTWSAAGAMRAAQARRPAADRCAHMPVAPPAGPSSAPTAYSCPPTRRRRARPRARRSRPPPTASRRRRCASPPSPPSCSRAPPRCASERRLPCLPACLSLL